MNTQISPLGAADREPRMPYPMPDSTLGNLSATWIVNEPGRCAPEGGVKMGALKGVGEQRSAACAGGITQSAQDVFARAVGGDGAELDDARLNLPPRRRGER